MDLDTTFINNTSSKDNSPNVSLWLHNNVLKNARASLDTHITHLKIKHTNSPRKLLAVLALATKLITGCSTGSNETTITPEITQDLYFLGGIAREYSSFDCDT